MKFCLLSNLILLIFAFNSYAQEVVTSYDPSSLPVLNEELRKLNRNLDNAVMDTGDQTVAGIKNFTSSPIVPTPTTDYQAATKKYVDDNAVSFSTWTNKTSSYGAQQATTNGIVCADFTGAGTIDGYTDGNADPARKVRHAYATAGDINGITFPVKKNDYWKVIITSGTVDSVWFLSLE